MTEAVEALLRDMLAWLAPAERPYDEALDAWRTNCPRLPVWEEAHDRGYLVHRRAGGAELVGLSPAGREFLRGG